jgi:hypothetical protein
MTKKNIENKNDDKKIYKEENLKEESSDESQVYEFGEESQEVEKGI